MNARSYCAEYYLLSDTKKLNTLNNVGVLVKSVFIDLCTHCVHAHHRARNLSSPEYRPHPKPKKKKISEMTKADHKLSKILFYQNNMF